MQTAIVNPHSKTLGDIAQTPMLQHLPRCGNHVHGGSEAGMCSWIGMLSWRRHVHMKQPCSHEAGMFSIKAVNATSPMSVICEWTLNRSVSTRSTIGNIRTTLMQVPSPFPHWLSYQEAPPYMPPASSLSLSLMVVSQHDHVTVHPCILHPVHWKPYQVHDLVTCVSHLARLAVNNFLFQT